MASRSAAGVDLAAFGLAPKRSAAAKGSYFKARTKAWLEKQGYVVAHLERMMWIRKGGPPCVACGQPAMFATKKDQLGSDLLAVKDGEPDTYVQVKLGTSSVMAARRAFVEFPLGLSARRWVVAWERGARAPQVIDCTADTAASLGAVRGRQQPQERLF